SSAQVKNAAGQRDIRSLVGIQLNAALPLRRPPFGNSGDGRAILLTSRTRLSQKTSSALLLAIGAARGFLALPSSGASRLSVVSPGSLRSISETFVAIPHSTRITNAPSVESIW